MIDGRKGWRTQGVPNAEAWYAIRELRRARVLERVDGVWKKPRAESMSYDEGAALLRTASGVGYRALPAMLDYALHPLLGDESLRWVLRLIEEADAMQRLWLDRRIRRSSGWGFRRAAPAAWWPRASTQQLTPDRVRRHLGAVTASAWQLFSMSPDGHLREKALEHLEGGADAMSLAHVLIRTLDWVREVRQRASGIWARSLSRLPPEGVIPLTPLVAHLARGTWQERAAYSPPDFARLDMQTIRHFLDRFAGPDGERALLASIRRGPSSQARGSLDLLLRDGHVTDAVVTVAFKSGDVAIQRRAFDLALGTDDLRDRTVAFGLKSRFSEIRKRALEQVSDKDGNQRSLVDQALFDRSEAVRSFARFLVKKAGGDPGAAYRLALDRPDTAGLVAAILGLADLERNWIVASDHLHDSRQRVREAAAIAIGRTDCDVAQETLPPLLADESPAVTSAARAALQRCGRMTLDQLSPYLRDPRTHVWRNASRLLRNCGAWQWLLGALQLARSDDLVRADAGIAQLRQWSRRLYLPHEGPPPGVRGSLEAAVNGVPVIPRMVLEAFAANGLKVPGYHNLLFGSNEEVETIAHDVANGLELRLVKRYSNRRGGWHYTTWPERQREDVEEEVVVQKNRDYGELAESEFAQWPTLVYVLSTPDPDGRASK